mmetsp:Transcript_28858/g.43581  ORF Transcript_28858/g.43581 Transcript_28858/m.43581 type:complete len:234 (-) Transcript_28858:880-1581(-)
MQSWARWGILISAAGFSFASNRFSSYSPYRITSLGGVVRRKLSVLRDALYGEVNLLLTGQGVELIHALLNSLRVRQAVNGHLDAREGVLRVVELLPHDLLLHQGIVDVLLEQVLHLGHHHGDLVHGHHHHRELVLHHVVSVLVHRGLLLGLLGLLRLLGLLGLLSSLRVLLLVRLLLLLLLLLEHLHVHGVHSHKGILAHHHGVGHPHLRHVHHRHTVHTHRLLGVVHSSSVG